MKDYIENRVLAFADSMLSRKCTVRDIASVSNVSKSTVHMDLNIRLRNIDFKLWQKVREVLDENLNERNHRGGLATKHKYKKDEV